jgi:hypothetical protein
MATEPLASNRLARTSARVGVEAAEKPCVVATRRLQTSDLEQRRPRIGSSAPAL